MWKSAVTLEDPLDQLCGQVVQAEVGEERREDRGQQPHAFREHRIHEEHCRCHRHKSGNESRNAVLRGVHADHSNKY